MLASAAVPPAVPPGSKDPEPLSQEPADRPSRQARLLPLFLAYCLHLALVAAILSGHLSPLFVDTRYRRGPGADFYAVYEAGYRLRTSQSLYDWNRPASGAPFAYPYRYLPIVAAFPGVPMSLLPPRVAFGAWVVVLEALCLFGALLIRRLGAAAPRLADAAVAMWLLNGPLLLELYMGQFSLPVAVSLLAVASSLARNDRPRLAAGAWIVGSLIKPTPLLLAPLFARERRYRTLAIAAFCFLLTCAPYFLAHPGELAAFLSTNTSGVGQQVGRSGLHAGNIGLPALYTLLASRLLPSLSQRLEDSFALLDWVWFAASLALLVLGFKKASRASALTAVAAIMFLPFFIYKHVWEHHLVMAMALLALLFLEGRSVSRRSIAVVFAFLALPSPLCLFCLPAGVPDPLPFMSTWQMIAHHGFKVLPLLLLFLAMSWPSRAKGGTAGG